MHEIEIKYSSIKQSLLTFRSSSSYAQVTLKKKKRLSIYTCVLMCVHSHLPWFQTWGSFSKSSWRICLQVGRLSSGPWWGSPRASCRSLGLPTWAIFLHLLPQKLLHWFGLDKHQALFSGSVFHIRCQRLILRQHLLPGMLFSAPLPLIPPGLSTSPRSRGAFSTLLLLGVDPPLLFESYTLCLSQ